MIKIEKSLAIMFVMLVVVVVMSLLLMQNFDNRTPFEPPIATSLYVVVLSFGAVFLLGLGWCLGIINSEQRANKKTKILESKLSKVIESSIVEQKK